MCLSVLSGSEETKSCVCSCGCGTLLNRGVYHSSDLSFSDGASLGVGVHPRVKTNISSSSFSVILTKSFVVPTLRRRVVHLIWDVMYDLLFWTHHCYLL